MKTQQELMQAYWGPGGIVDMVKEYNAKHGCDVKPWECIRLGDNLIDCHPSFDFPLDYYKFALTILYDDKRKKHRPVFVGDRLYLNGDEFVVGMRALIHEDRFSWNPQEPKRTFKIGDMELPCPLKTEPCADNLNYATLCHDGREYYFESYEDKQKWRMAFTRSLLAARDKE